MCVWAFIHVLICSYVYVCKTHVYIQSTGIDQLSNIYTQIDFHQSNIIISNLKQK